MERHCKVAIALCVLPRQIAGGARTEVVAAASLHILTADPPLDIWHENPPLLLVRTADSGDRALQVGEPDNLPSIALTVMSAFPPEFGLQFPQLHPAAEGNSKGRVHSDEDPQSDERDANDARCPLANRDNLFGENRCRDEKHPLQGHRARYDKDDHERPATADTVRCVLAGHFERSEISVSPVPDQERQRVLADSKTDPLPAGELVRAGGYQDQHQGVGEEARQDRMIPCCEVEEHSCGPDRGTKYQPQP